MSTLGSETGYKYAYEVQVAGLDHEERRELVEAMGLKVGERLQLVPEPDNAHDENAVAVYARGEKIGYVPAFKSEMVARYLAQGKMVSSSVCWFDFDDRDLLQVGLFLGMDQLSEQAGPTHSEAPASDPSGHDPEPTAPGERMVAAGEKLSEAGGKMQKAGMNVMGCGCAVVILIVLGFLAYSCAR